MKTRLSIALPVLALILVGPAGIPSASGMGDPALSDPTWTLTFGEKAGETMSGPDSYEVQEPVETGVLPEPGAESQGGFIPLTEPGESEAMEPGIAPLEGGDGPAREEFTP